MERVIIEDVEPIVVERLEALAREHGRSLQAELKHILEEAIQVQYVNKTDIMAGAKTPVKLGWPPSFFERTAGCLQDEPLVRYAQGELPERELLE